MDYSDSARESNDVQFNQVADVYFTFAVHVRRQMFKVFGINFDTLEFCQLMARRESTTSFRRRRYSATIASLREQTSTFGNHLEYSPPADGIHRCQQMSIHCH
jgi:hypothetical protein